MKIILFAISFLLSLSASVPALGESIEEYREAVRSIRKGHLEMVIGNIYKKRPENIVELFEKANNPIYKDAVIHLLLGLIRSPLENGSIEEDTKVVQRTLLDVLAHSRTDSSIQTIRNLEKNTNMSLDVSGYGISLDSFVAGLGTPFELAAIKKEDREKETVN